MKKIEPIAPSPSYEIPPPPRGKQMLLPSERMSARTQRFEDESFNRYKRACYLRLVIKGLLYFALGLAAGYLIYTC